MSLFNQHLVEGYIHRIQKHFEHQIIPDSITSLCLKYYFFRQAFLLLYEKRPEQKLALSLVDLSPDTNSDLSPLHFITTQLNAQSEKYPQDGQYTLSQAKSIKLPSSIENIVKSEFKTKDVNPKYDIIIKTGRYNNYNALILPNLERSQSKLDTVLNWRLPDYPVDCSGNCLVYSDEYGLVSIGGNSGIPWGDDLDSVYHLPFNSASNDTYDYTDWKWQKMRGMKSVRYKPCGVIIETETKTTQKLMAIGGCKYNEKLMNDEYLYTAEMYDFESNSWTDLPKINIARRQCGVYHCDKTECVYIAGGSIGRSKVDADLESMNEPGNKIEYLEIHKQKWINMKAVTNKNYSYKPIMWKQGNHIMYIAATCVNKMERLDLREDATKWTIVSDLDCAFDVKLGLHPAGIIQYR